MSPLLPLLAGMVVLAQGPAAASVEPLSWAPCPGRGGLECATLAVPLDHGRPQAERLPLTVWRLRATGPGPRLGSLVLLDGAPGSADALPLQAMARALQPSLRARLDLVSWQRRGTGARGEPAALHCWPSEREAAAWRARLPSSLPRDAADQARWRDSWGDLARACGQHQARLLPHLSSADSARDLELLRQALGEPALRLRASGAATMVGATYANLFPGSLAALVLDGPVDPLAWSDNGNPLAAEGTDYRLERDLAIGATVMAFLQHCASVGRPRCAFAATGASGPRAATERAYADLLARSRQRPPRWGDTRIDTGALVSQLARRLQTVSPDGEGRGGWEGTARFLAVLARGGGGAAGADVLPEEDAPEQALAQRCGESPNPRQLEIFQALAEQGQARSGPPGAWVVWGDSRCAAWPEAAAPYRGPWNTPTPRSVLVIGHRYNPVLPFQSALAMARELDQGRLLSVNGHGHTVLRNPSACVGVYEVAYLLSGLLPPPGTVCGPDGPPFAARP